jgi:hypothetical protein
MSARIEGIQNEQQARRALEEIERLITNAAATGMRLDPWVSELADELRASIPAMDAEGAASIARRIAGDPRLSLIAQGGVRAETLRALRP